MLNIKLTILLALGSEVPRCVGDPITGPCMQPTSLLIMSCFAGGVGTLMLAVAVVSAIRRREAQGAWVLALMCLLAGGAGFGALYLHANLTLN